MKSILSSASRIVVPLAAAKATYDTGSYVCNVARTKLTNYYRLATGQISFMEAVFSNARALADPIIPSSYKTTEKVIEFARLLAFFDHGDPASDEYIMWVERATTCAQFIDSCDALKPYRDDMLSKCKEVGLEADSAMQLVKLWQNESHQRRQQHLDKWSSSSAVTGEVDPGHTPNWI